MGGSLCVLHRMAVNSQGLLQVRTAQAEDAGI